MTIRDLKIETIDGAEWFSFRFGGSGDFEAAIKSLKEIPLEHRKYDPEDDHRWRVRSDYISKLTAIFNSFSNALDILKSQGALF
jgi:hypothetical protein